MLRDCKNDFIREYFVVLDLLRENFILLVFLNVYFNTFIF